MNRPEEVSFSFDELKILGMIGPDIFIEGWYFKEIEESDDCELVKCIVIIDRPLFHVALDNWLNDKKRLCELHNHFCGVGGRISCTSFTKLDSKYSIIDSFDEEKEDVVYIEVDAFKIDYIEQECDMEHG